MLVYQRVNLPLVALRSNWKISYPLVIKHDGGKYPITGTSMFSWIRSPGGFETGPGRAKLQKNRLINYQLWLPTLITNFDYQDGLITNFDRITIYSRFTSWSITSTAWDQPYDGTPSPKNYSKRERNSELDWWPKFGRTVTESSGPFQSIWHGLCELGDMALLDLEWFSINTHQSSFTS